MPRNKTSRATREEDQMKFISSSIKFLVLALVFVLMAAACSPEAASTPTDAAVATADGSGGDSGVGGSDGSAADNGKDVAVDQDINNPDVGTDTGGGTDAAALICSDGEEVVIFKDWLPMCFSNPEKEALNLLDTHTAVPATTCPSLGDSDFCLADFKLEPPSEKNGCFLVTLWYPKNLKVKYTFTFDECDEVTGVCKHEKVFDNGDRAEIILDIKKKLFSDHYYGVKSGADEKDYKLIPK